MVDDSEMDIIEAEEASEEPQQRDTIEYNVNKWKKKKGANILYVTGLSGSGKSVLAKDISNTSGATHFQLDWLDPNYRGVLPKNTLIRKINKSKSFHSRVLQIRDLMEADYKTLYVLEGIQILRDYTASELEGKSVIIMDVDIFSAYYSRMRRASDNKTLGGGKISLQVILRNKPFALIKMYFEWNLELEKFKKTMKKQSDK